MAIAFVDSDAVQTSSGADLTASVSGSVGDIAIAGIAEQFAADATAPAGWTLVAGPLNAGTDPRVRVWYKVLTGSDSFAWTGPSAWSALAVGIYSGASYHAFGTASGTNLGGNPGEHAGVTTSVDDCWVVGFGFTGNSASSLVINASLTERENTANGSRGVASLADIVTGSAGAQGPWAIVSSAYSGRWEAISVALAPAAGGSALPIIMQAHAAAGWR